MARLPLNENKIFRCRLAKNWGLRPKLPHHLCFNGKVGCSNNQATPTQTRSSNSVSRRLQCWQASGQCCLRNLVGSCDPFYPNPSLSDTPSSSPNHLYMVRKLTTTTPYEP